MKIKIGKLKKLGYKVKLNTKDILILVNDESMINIYKKAVSVSKVNSHFEYSESLSLDEIVGVYDIFMQIKYKRLARLFMKKVFSVIEVIIICLLYYLFVVTILLV